MKKLIIIVDAFLIVGTLLVLGYFGTFAITGNPVLEFPEDGANSSRSVLFSFDNAEYILIDDNLDFSSARKIETNEEFVILLEPGNYYWKAVGEKESEIRYFTILSEVELELRKSEEGYDVVNAGNTILNVDFYDNGQLIKKDSFGPGQNSEAEGDLIVGGQNE